MDNKPGLLLAATGRTAHEVIEFLDQEFIRSKPLVSRVSFRYSADEPPWQVGIDGAEASQGAVGTVENSMPVGLVNEAQIHQSLLRVRAPPKAGHVLLCRQRSKLTEPNKCGPLRQEHLTLECTYKPPIQYPAIH